MTGRISQTLDAYLKGEATRAIECGAYQNVNAFITRQLKVAVDLAINGGKLEKGHNAGATTTLTMPGDVMRKVFLEFDMNAAMQAFMSGQIKAQGDMTKLMALQTARPSAEQKALFAQVVAIS